MTHELKEQSDDFYTNFQLGLNGAKEYVKAIHKSLGAELASCASGQMEDNISELFGSDWAELNKEYAFHAITDPNEDLMKTVEKELAGTLADLSES